MFVRTDGRVKKFGEGGFGKVRPGLELRLGLGVAIKKFNEVGPEIGRRIKAYSRMIRELEFGARLGDDPHFIVPSGLAAYPGKRRAFAMVMPVANAGDMVTQSALPQLDQS